MKTRGCTCCGNEIPTHEDICNDCKNSLEPVFCNTCPYTKPVGCQRAASECKRWRAWFKYQWKVIRDYYGGDRRDG